MRNIIGIPPLPPLGSNRKEKPHAQKVSAVLTDQVLLAVGARYKGVKVSKRVALEVALSEWLEDELGGGDGT